ncbi:Gmad2 immunoglobulin-like domain-containing protein [Flaviaesturariibacter aridisoli]|uniref:Uncharacterized protein n=1 Tax=Flaviaesturariibacter aridisoli TaxID=2545761 RepID=A0A4R4DRU1_9BACT|nr:Gmad2 immunoglobulin-like domain-containing protein [Flaviaesturariibacter aridisoli]TCZ65299.1 hypothetical protein E0486_17550 [Flaviaesturariibacter aridisoli]
MRSVLPITVLAVVLVACGPGNGHPEAKDTVSLGPVAADTPRRVPPAAPAPGKDTDTVAPADSPQLRGLRAGDTLRSPARIEGTARGTWYFEGQFVLKLYDSLNRLLALIPARATTDWMTEEYVPFRGVLEWKKYSGRGMLVLEADNPSGDEERAKRLKVGVWLK